MLAAMPARARTSTIVAAILAYAIAIALIWSVLFPWAGLNVLVDATGGLVQPTFVAALLIAALVGVVLASGSLSLDDVGLTARDLARALGVLLVVYAAVQVGLAASALISGDELHAGAALRDDPARTLGSVIAQLFGTAIVEEVMFRGFLLRQLVLRARERYPERRAVAVAVAGAALVFAAMHIGQHLYLGFRGLYLIPSLAFVWLGGVVASYLYLRSGNLAVVIVLHALFNEPAPLVASPVSPQIMLGVVVLGVIVWIERDARLRLRIIPRPLLRQPP